MTFETTNQLRENCHHKKDWVFQSISMVYLTNLFRSLKKIIQQHLCRGHWCLRFISKHFLFLGTIICWIVFFIFFQIFAANAKGYSWFLYHNHVLSDPAKFAYQFLLHRFPEIFLGKQLYYLQIKTIFFLFCSWCFSFSLLTNYK